MELNILTSKKGTRVIKTSNLHRALGLADHHYQVNVRNWLKDVYQFADGIRRPEGMKDYARSTKTAGKVIQEYYLHLELARLIALATKSRTKQAVATKILKEEAVHPDTVRLTSEQTMALLEQVKAMTRLSCQEAAEQRHLAQYVRRRGSKDWWNRYRLDNVVHTSMEELRERLEKQGHSLNKSLKLRDLLLRYDGLECIRVGIVDHYAAQGYSMPYAAQMGNLARELAEMMGLEVVDDRKGELLFAPATDSAVVRQLQRVA